MEDFGCIIPVAGISSRMVDFKPLLLINNITMIEHTVMQALCSGIDQCILILGYQGEEIEKAIAHYDKNKVICVYNHDYLNTDMLYSIKIGIQTMLKYEKKGAFIVPGDMPKISSSTFHLIAQYYTHHAAAIVFPTIQGKPKHPPLLSMKCFHHILNFNADGGLRKALEKFKAETFYLEVNDYGCCLDADTKEEFETLIKYQSEFNELIG